ncbi:MAG TPA: hypothetical protein VE093_03650, partial [Polyangiaceae bacterium]|nr:hypothetical protein [Polyangiaceae bacterium]
GSPCTGNGGTVCNNMGACVECVPGIAECMAPDICQNGMCNLPTCANVMKDGTETDIDCGGPDCSPCATNKNCMVPSDCISTVCTSGKCQAATCTDTVKNGTETDVDCGGASCPGCAEGQVCLANSDCASGNCFAGFCGPSGAGGAGGAGGVGGVGGAGGN